jgi:hypothetical protein
MVWCSSWPLDVNVVHRSCLIFSSEPCAACQKAPSPDTRCRAGACPGLRGPKVCALDPGRPGLPPLPTVGNRQAKHIQREKAAASLPHCMAGTARKCPNSGGGGKPRPYKTSLEDLFVTPRHPRITSPRSRGRRRSNRQGGKSSRRPDERSASPLAHPPGCLHHRWSSH